MGDREVEVAMTVRRATEADAAEVTALWLACGLVVPTNDPMEDFRFALLGASSAVLVHEDAAGRVDGSVMVGHDGHRGWMYYMAAAPAVQGTGVGRAMVMAAERWLRERGVRKAQLMVRETNAGVVAFYERMGFAVTPRVVMSKRLE